MSAANASAKKRRAMIAPTESFPNVGGRPYVPPPRPTGPGAPPVARQNQPPPPPQGFTLQQVISVIDKRLVNLEKGFGEINKNQSSNLPVASAAPALTTISENHPTFEDFTQHNLSINETLNEYDSRFEILANEIADLKSVVFKLQSYTMDVNRMLLNERNQNMSDVNENTDILNGLDDTIPSAEPENNDSTLEELQRTPLILNNYSLSNSEDIKYTFNDPIAETTDATSGVF